MVTIYDLNWDILENVIVCGCNDELEYFFGSRSRRRKRFAAAFRGVCKVWKDWIDECAGAHKKFWIARTDLRVVPCEWLGGLKHSETFFPAQKVVI
jgi:hypothetical protein